MKVSRIKQYLEPVGLVLLLLAFGWQCWEEQANQLKYEGYIYELDQKLEAIWDGVYDEALHSDRYNGEALVSVNYDALNKTVRDWGQIEKDFTTLNRQTAHFFWARVVLYLLGSAFVIFGKWPSKHIGS